MKGMSQRLALLLALVLGASTSAFAFNPFGLFGSNDGPSLEGLLASVPADTVFFVGGSTDADAADFFSDWVPGTSEADLEELSILLNGGADNPSLAMMFWLLSDYMATATGGYDELYSRYGLGRSIDSVAYMDGVVPVLRLTLEDSDALLALLDEAVAETEAQYSERELADATLRVWPLTEAHADFQIELAVLVHQDVLTISFLVEGEQEAQQAQRFGLAEMPNSMASADIWGELGLQYGFNDQMRGYVSFNGIAEGLLSGDATRLGQDLQRLVPELFEEMEDELSASCRAEWLELSRQSPRLVFGADNFEVSADALSQSVRFIWELTNAEVNTSLSRLPGSLPAYSLNSSDKLFAFALGLNVDALAPVATELWSLFVQADFECEQLIELQQQAQAFNPAMIGMVSGMAQGVKGVGMAIYSLVADPEAPMGVTPSVLVSLSAENPQMLAPVITASIPGMAGVRIPTNGDAVSLPVPGVPVELFAAIKGKHLVVYSGTEGEQAANQLAEEALNTQGITALALNYQKTGETLLDMLEAIPEMQMNPLLFADEMGGCDQAYLLALQFAQLPMQFTYSDTYNDKGWEGHVDVQIERMSAMQPELSGSFQVASLDYDCSWTTSGTETLNSDGTGQYSESDVGGQCDLYQLDYSWSQSGLSMTQEATMERIRDTCSDDWETFDAETYVCHLVGEHDSGFYCLYYFDAEPTLLRYSR